MKTPFIENKELSCYSFYLPHQKIMDTSKDDDKVDTGSAFTSDQLNSWFQALHPSQYEDEPDGHAWTDASYKNQLLLRKTAWHTFDERCSCEYGYSDTWQKLIKSSKMMNVLEDITNAVSNMIGDEGSFSELNSVNLNWYPQGGGVGFHADDEFLFDGINRETRIVSLSLCSPDPRINSENIDTNTHENNWGARKFRVKRKGKKHSSEIQEIILRHGDLMTMEGMFQKYYLHSVWPGDSTSYANTEHELCQGERINLTWRTIVRHLDGSDECRGLICPLSNQKSVI
jgi:alkylated DNA repair dioxygenase AlkB